jgi:hypothetical protein|tara:strand:+ start:32 stop:424 length:393 start_codon:yes stop_codon:yes gene_type:complete
MSDSDREYINYGKKYNLDESVFDYSIDKDPNTVFTDKKNIKVLITHSCYCHKQNDYLKDEICNVDIVNSDGNINYIDIFNECTIQYKIFLNDIIEDNNLDIKYSELLCNHGFVEGFDELDNNLYLLSRGS